MGKLMKSNTASRPRPLTPAAYNVRLQLEIPDSYRKILVSKRDSILPKIREEEPQIVQSISVKYEMYCCKCEQYEVEKVDYDLWSSIYLILENVLSDAERSVLYQIMMGHHNKAISSELYITLNTVKDHIKSINRKFSLPIKEPWIANKFAPRTALMQLVSLCWFMLDRQKP